MQSSRALRSVAAQLSRVCTQYGCSSTVAEALAARTTQATCTVLARHESHSSLSPPPAPPLGQSAIERNLMVNTLDMARRFEQLGMNREQAERLTVHVTEILCDNKERLASTYVSQTVLEKAVSDQEARIFSFKNEVTKQQETLTSTFTRDTERLQTNLEKVRSEIRYEIDKLTASQRLDLNLEKGRMRDELQMLRDKTNELEIKMDKEVNSLKAAMEQSKNDTVKYVLGLMLALLTAGLGAARVLMH
ncbi:hypothetical protein N2152v2_001593 [Parachlorella kessleri]